MSSYRAVSRSLLMNPCKMLENVLISSCRHIIDTILNVPLLSRSIQHNNNNIFILFHRLFKPNVYI